MHNKVEICESVTVVSHRSKLKVGSIYKHQSNENGTQFYMVVKVRIGSKDPFLLVALASGYVWTYGGTIYAPSEFELVPKGTCIKLTTQEG